MTLLAHRHAYLYSLVTHGVLLAALLLFDQHSAQIQTVARRSDAARAHTPVLERNETEAGADRLRKIRELAERLEHERTNQEVGQTSKSEPTAPQAKNTSPRDLPQVYEQSKRDYLSARQQLLTIEAKHLAKITGQSLASAQTTVEAQRPGSGSGSKGTGTGAGASNSQMQAEIGQMQLDAQQMLGRVLELQRADQQGVSLSSEEARSAYRMANTSQQLAEEARGFAPAVDWTRLMGRPLSGVAINGVLDHEDVDFRQVESQAERKLRSNFLSHAESVRFGRRIGKTGTEHGEWICPDAWYIIGPFDNPRREAIDKSFPPEVEIDRDATYFGKDGQPVSWEYTRVSQIGVIPPHPEEYAIYYAYTEIYAAQEMDCWLALGSDDHSKLWVNGFLVWSGTRNLKNWSPTEGFRRVRLNAGFNRFLLRLENGWNGTMFSIAIQLE